MWRKHAAAPAATQQAQEKAKHCAAPRHSLGIAGSGCRKPQLQQGTRAGGSQLQADSALGRAAKAAQREGALRPASLVRTHKSWMKPKEKPLIAFDSSSAGIMCTFCAPKKTQYLHTLCMPMSVRGLGLLPCQRQVSPCWASTARGQHQALQAHSQQRQNRDHEEPARGSGSGGGGSMLGACWCAQQEPGPRHTPRQGRRACQLTRRTSPRPRQSRSSCGSEHVKQRGGPWSSWAGGAFQCTRCEARQRRSATRVSPTQTHQYTTSE